MKTRLIILAVAMLIPVVATGQSAPVAAGTRVRVTAPGNNLDKHVTTVVDVRVDSIVLNVRNSLLVVGLADVTELEVSTGKRTQFWRGAGYGLGLGVVAGALVGAVSYKECESDHFLGCMMAPHSASESATWGGIVFGALGLVGGLSSAWLSVRIDGRPWPCRFALQSRRRARAGSALCYPELSSWRGAPTPRAPRRPAGLLQTNALDSAVQLNR